MWDRNGKKVLDGHITLPDVVRVSVRGVGATSEGGVLASGRATTLRGSTHGFIAKTDSTGRVIQSLDTGAFLPRKVCEAKDGTVWSLGYPELDSLDRSLLVVHERVPCIGVFFNVMSDEGTL